MSFSLPVLEFWIYDSSKAVLQTWLLIELPSNQAEFSASARHEWMDSSLICKASEIMQSGPL